MRTKILTALTAVCLCLVCTNLNAQKREVNLVENAATFEAISAEKAQSKLYKREEGQTIYRDSIVRKVADGKIFQHTYTRVFKKTSLKEISLEEKREFLAGERTIADPAHKTLSGAPRHNVNVSLLGTGAYIRDKFHAGGIVRVGWEGCHLLAELEGGLMTVEYPGSSVEGKGNYLSYSAMGNVGVKLWQNRTYRSYIALLGTVGYSWHKSDEKNATFFSEGWGLSYGGILRGVWGFSNNFSLVGEFNYKSYPEILHTGGTQEFNWAPGISLGLRWRFLSY